MTEHRSGFACLVGRPNTGKSTLTNALVGAKVAITSNRPQTTRHTIRGIVTRPDVQLVLVDTPGLHKPRTLLGERLNDRVRETWATVDAACLCIAADEKVGPGDIYIARELAELRRTQLFAIVTKVDKVDRDTVLERLTEITKLGVDLGITWTHVVPVSAVRNEQVELLRDLLLDAMPVGPALYPDGDITDEPEMTLAAELIREAALEGVRDELPHSIAVLVEEMELREGRSDENPLLDIFAEIYVERSSQKAIMIGKGGERLRDVGTKARKEIERRLGTPVFLQLKVKIAKDWQRDPKQLRRLGF